MNYLSRNRINHAAPWKIYENVFKGPLNDGQVEEFASIFGEVSVRDGNCAVWPIKARKSVGTFSETDGEAELHTDSQYHANPEKAFVLACERPAKDGGVSILLDSKDARSVANSVLGKEGVKLLELPIWSWSVPEVFQKNGLAKASPPTSIFSEDGSIRWRIDNIICQSSELLRLAEDFACALANASQTQRVLLGVGDVLYCDNRFALHGRTSFSDQERLLYRVRLT